jgi:hypothetical protein
MKTSSKVPSLRRMASADFENFPQGLCVGFEVWMAEASNFRFYLRRPYLTQGIIFKEK